MTCIIGLETEDGVMMGCDSAAVAGYDITVSRIQKVFKRGEFLIGYTTSFRMGQLLQYGLEVEPQRDDQSDIEFLATTFIDAARDCLKKGGFTRVEDEQEEGGFFLLGYKGKLYIIQSDFQVNSSVDGYMAIGCGANYALGAMHATPDVFHGPRIYDALETAGYFSNGVCPPYMIVRERE